MLMKVYTVTVYNLRVCMKVLTISREIISSVEMGEYFHDFFYHSLVVCRCEFFNYQVNFHIFHIVLVFYVRNRWLLKTTTFMKEFDRVCCFCFKLFSLLNCSNSLLLVVNVVLILGIKNFSEQYFSLVCFLSVCEKCFVVNGMLCDVSCDLTMTKNWDNWTLFDIIVHQSLCACFYVYAMCICTCCVYTYMPCVYYICCVNLYMPCVCHMLCNCFIVWFSLYFLL